MSEPTFEATSRSFQSDKWKLHYHDLGEGHPVIFLHGSGAGAAGWNSFHQNLIPLSQSFRTIALDLPGFGDSDTFEGEIWERTGAHADAVAMLMDHLGLEKAVIVGNSMGGGAAFNFSLRYPERLSHLISMGSGIFTLPYMMHPQNPTEGHKALMENYRNPCPDTFRKVIEIMVYDPSFITDELLQARTDAALKNPEHLANFLRISDFNTPHVNGDLIAKLNKIPHPTLLIHGRDDRTMPLEMSLTMLSIIPNSRLHVFNKCAHWAQIEHATEFNALVQNFITTVPGN